MHNFGSTISGETWEFECWFYDNMSAPILTFAFAVGGASILGIQIGTSNYGYKYDDPGGNQTNIIHRSLGWHRANIVCTPTNATLSVDGLLLFYTNTQFSFNRFFFGDWWIDAAICKTYYDDISVWKYQSIQPTPSPTPTLTPSSTPTPTPLPTSSPTPVPNDCFTNTFEWRYKGHDFTWTVDIPVAMYQEYKNIPASTRTLKDALSGLGYVTTTKDPFVKKIAMALNDTATQQGFNPYQTVSFVLAFVQSLPYTSDSVTTGHDEYHRFPIETLVDDGGDCEDTSALFGTLVLDLGYGVAYIKYPNHMAVSVKGGELSGYYFTFNNNKYYYCETTGDGWQIGDLPNEFVNATARLYVPDSAMQYVAKSIPNPLPSIALPYELSPTPQPTSTATPTPQPISTAQPTPIAITPPPTNKPTMSPTPTSIATPIPSPEIPEFPSAIVLIVLATASIIAIKLSNDKQQSKNSSSSKSGDKNSKL